MSEPTSSGTEYVVSNDCGDAWVCICGNEPHVGGFFTCTPEGVEVEPTDNTWDGKHLVCTDCGRVMDQTGSRLRTAADGPLPARVAHYDPEDVSHVVPVVLGPSEARAAQEWLT